MTRHRQTLYSLRTHIAPDRDDQYFITKFVDGEVESAYICTPAECECPAGHRPSCRHRQMLPEMLARGLVNTHFFWDFDHHRAVDFNGLSMHLYDAVAEPEAVGPAESTSTNELDLTELAAIPGVSVFTLDGNPATLHNAIADAVGEPEAKIIPQTGGKTSWRRM